MVSRVGWVKTPSLSNYIYYINPLHKNHPSHWYVFYKYANCSDINVTAMAMKATLLQMVKWAF